MFWRTVNTHQPWNETIEKWRRRSHKTESNIISYLLSYIYLPNNKIPVWVETYADQTNSSSARQPDYRFLPPMCGVGVYRILRMGNYSITYYLYQPDTYPLPNVIT